MIALITFRIKRLFTALYCGEVKKAIPAVLILLGEKFFSCTFSKRIYNKK